MWCTNLPWGQLSRQMLELAHLSPAIALLKVESWVLPIRLSQTVTGSALCLLHAVWVTLALLIDWRSFALMGDMPTKRGESHSYDVEGWIVGHSSCKSFSIAEQNANGVSVLIFVVSIFHCYIQALKAPNMNSLCLRSTSIVFTE